VRGSWLAMVLCLVVGGCDDSEEPVTCDDAGECADGFHCVDASNACEADCTDESCAATGELCNPGTGLCAPDCTAGGCEGELVCDPATRFCQESCNTAGCDDDAHCDPESGLCVPDCDDDSCGDGQWCNPESLDCEPVVVLADASLEACVRAELGVEGAPILPPAAAEVTHLECPDMGIASLEGLEAFTGLVHLTLWENDIADIAPLETMVDVEYLQLGNNQIADLAPLGGMEKIVALGLSDNQIEDVSPLAELTTLVWLNLDDNLIADVSPLADLTKLTWLTLEGNQVDEGSIDELPSTAEIYAARDRAAARLERGGAIAGGAGPSGARPAAGSILNFTTDDAGVVSFELLVDGEIHEARREYAGDVLFDSRYFTYRVGRDEIRIGEIDGGVASLCSGAYEQVCDFAIGRRFPQPGDRAPAALGGGQPPPVVTVALTLARPNLIFDPPANEDFAYGEYDDALDPFVLASPNQFDAGSCVFMANTGAMEILLNQHTPLEDIAYEGGTDLSERFLMNASNHADDAEVPYFITDLVYTYNVFGGSMLNRDYRFTAGYVCDTASGTEACASSDPDAYFSCQYNWIDELPDGWEDMLVETPEAERTLIFVDPNLDENSIWRVGLMNDDVVARIKYELRTKRAPVVVVYNHYLYWHAVLVVGYDDARSIGGCPMVEGSMTYYEENGAGAYADRIEQRMEDDGGCHENGVFFVRDSIYDGTTEELWYDYSERYDFRERYSQRIVTHEYDWARFLGNHAYSVHRR
jgi:hypothetical protein